MNATRNTLPTATRRKAGRVPNTTVAELFDLCARIKQAHWNLRGQSFFAFQKLLDEFAAATWEHVDLAAEHATALGELADLRAACAGHVRRTIKRAADEDDFVTADPLTGVLRDLDKPLWILEAHLETK